MSAASPSVPASSPSRAAKGRVRIPAIVIGLAVLLVGAVAVLLLVVVERPGGGETVVVEAEVPRYGEEISRILEERIATLEAGEPRIEEVDERTLEIELPPVDDVNDVTTLLAQRGEIEVRPVVAAPDGSEPAGSEMTVNSEGGTELALGPVRMDSSDISGAELQWEDASSAWAVEVDFEPSRSGEWEELVGDAACHPPGDPQRQVALLMDGELLSAPAVPPDTACGDGPAATSTLIQGNFSQEEAARLAAALDTDALPTPVEVSMAG